MSEFISFVAICGFVLALASHIWLIVLMMRANTWSLLLAIIIPFMPLIFAVQNWDIARRTVICMVIGWTVFFGLGFFIT